VIPVWLLDIDDVLNTVRPAPQVWPADQWRTGEITIGVRLKLAVAQPVLDFVRGVHETGRAEIRWHTTWQQDAHKFADLFGLPEFPIADPGASPRWGQSRVSWWKLPAAQRVLADEDRPLLWIDDEIRHLPAHQIGSLHDLGPCELIAPKVDAGIARRHLREINAFLDLFTPAAVPALTEGDTR